MTFPNEVGYALREDSSLPGSGAGNHKHWTMNVSDGLLLPFIGNNVFRR